MKKGIFNNQFIYLIFNLNKFQIKIIIKVVAFSDKIRMLNIYENDFVIFKEI